MFSRLLLAATLLTLACSDMVIFRAGQDYFPLAVGTRWRYLDSSGDTLVDSVVGDSVIGGRTCTVVYRTFAPEFWIKTQTDVQRFIRRDTILSGNEYVLEKRYSLEYPLPLVRGDTWAETFEDTIVLFGTDSIFLLDRVSGRVAAVEEEVTTPAGTFIQCYRLEISREVRTDSTRITAWTDWLAPGVGLVKRQTGTGEQKLLDYRIGPSVQ